MNKNKIISILGEKYKVIFDENIENTNNIGTCDWSTNTIKVCKTLDDTPLINEVQNLKLLKNKVTRHEVIHAMMFESGLGECCDNHNEVNVDWIARMYPKMKKIFKELGCE